MRNVLIFLIALFLYSCSPKTGRLFKTPKDFSYKAIVSDTSFKEYQIKAFDEFEFSLLTNKGEKSLESAAGTQSTYLQPIKLNVDFDGTVKFPLIGSLYVKGKTVKQLEKDLEDKYAFYYQQPFVKLKITNFKIIVFNGSEFNNGKVITVQSNQINLIEAIALAGGVNDGKSNQIKLIRGSLSNPEVYHIDLSTMEKAKKCNIMVQPDDVIYVEQRNRVPGRIAAEISTYLTIVSSIILIYTIFK